MAQGSLRAAAVAALLAIGACASPAPKPAPPPAPTPAPAPAPTPPPIAETLPPVLADSCGARPLQYLVGKPHTEIPVPLEPSRRRVICSTCVRTEDLVSTRQTIVYDSETGLVTSVSCG